MEGALNLALRLGLPANTLLDQLLHKEGGASLYQAYRRAVRRLTDVHLNANVQCLPTDNHCGVLASNTDSTGMCMLCRHADLCASLLKSRGYNRLADLLKPPVVTRPRLGFSPCLGPL